MSVEAVGAILIFSNNPEELVGFYKNSFGFPIEEENHGGASLHWGCMIGSTHFAIHHSRLNRGKPGIAFSLATRSLEADLGQLERQGLVPLHRPIDMGNGAKRSTILDPDGNTVSLVQIAETWRKKE